jgi:hypothetical protein
LEEPAPIVTELIVEEENWEGILEYRQLLDEFDYLKWLGELEKIKNEQGRNTC